MNDELKRARLRREVEEMEASVPRWEAWRDEEGLDAAEWAERAEVVNQLLHHTREAREALDSVKALDRRIALMQEHAIHKDETWGEIQDRLSEEEGSE